MSVSYSQEQKAATKESHLHLVTISAGGMEFQGPTSDEERNELVKYLLAFLDRRRAQLQQEKPGAQVHQAKP